MKSGIFRLLAVIIVVTASCSKKDTVKPTENPITRYIDTDPSIFTVVSNVGEREIGVVFTPVLNGKITQLGVRMPQAAAYRVTLWDAAKKTVLSQQLITESTDGQLSFIDITAIPVTANTKYVVSVNNRPKTGDPKPPYYAGLRSNKDIMPYIQGNINLLNIALNGTTSDFPDQSVNKTAFYGFPEITFIPD